MRPRYTVNAERTGAWWAITVSELPGVFSQARRVEQVESMVRDAISLYLDAPRDSFDVVIREVSDAGASHLVTTAKATPRRS